MAIVDSKPLRERTRRMDVHLDVVHADDASLVADLERRLGGTVLHHEVNDVDYVRQTMLVDVRYRAGARPRGARGRAAARRHAGRGPRRRRRAGRRPRAPAGRAGAAPPRQGHRLRARHHGGRGALPRLVAGRPDRGHPISTPARRLRPRLRRQIRRCGHEHASRSGPPAARPARAAVSRRPGPGPRRAPPSRPSPRRRAGRPDRPRRADGARRAADPGGPQVLRARRRLPHG